jgi:hypothetical protein
MAGVLAAGDGAVLSHRSAAELWSLLQPRNAPPHLTIPHAAGRRKRSGLIVHRSRTLQESNVTRCHSIPVTTPARTIADLRRLAEPHEVRRAIRQAEYLGLPLAAITTDRTRSDLEGAVLALCRRSGLPPPEVNVKIGRYTADFLWREQHLVVEADGWQAHRGRQAFLDDRARDAHLRVRGFEVLRFSDEQVEEEQTLVTLLRGRLT